MLQKNYPSQHKGVTILTYLQDCLQQELQQDLSEFLLVFHEVVGTELDLLSGIKAKQCTINIFLLFEGHSGMYRKAPILNMVKPWRIDVGKKCKLFPSLFNGYQLLLEIISN
jgi:hypothetical protein